MATSWTTPNARPEGYHAYKVRACNSAGCSGWTGSYTIHVQFGTPPDAPNPLTASPNPSTTGLFTVSWSNVGSGIIYKLFETTGGGSWVTLVNAVDATNWTPNTPRPIGSYTFVAHACNASGCSQSYPLTVTVQEDTTIPPPTSSIWASPNPSTDGNYTVQWTAVSGASYYKLYKKDNGVEQGVIQNSASLSWSPSSPRVTGDYEYWVIACKILGNGTHVCSEISTVHTERVRRPGVPPAPDWISFSANDPGNTQVVCNNTSPRTFTLYWGAVSSSDLDHYEILESNHVTGAMPNTIISRPAGQPDQPPPAYASFTRAKVPPDTSTSYYYQVRACNPIGGDEGCSGFRGTAEFCVGNTSGNAPQRVVSTTYYHTDALGTPVAETNATGTVTKRSRYEPYGLPADGTFADAPGYTGHVADSFTQLSYMQQRYYDPLMGRFLSTDSLVTDGSTGANFNRFWYAENNPYEFTDPDGRAVSCANSQCVMTADTYNAARSNGQTVVASPSVRAAAVAGQSQVAAGRGPEKLGFIVKDDSGKPVVQAASAVTTGSTATGNTASAAIPQGALAGIHGHIDKGPDKSNGMVDDPKSNGGFGDTQALKAGLPMATVSQGQVGWHEIQNGQLQFTYPEGALTGGQEKQMQKNLDNEQKLFEK